MKRKIIICTILILALGITTYISAKPNAEINDITNNLRNNNVNVDEVTKINNKKIKIKIKSQGKTKIDKDDVFAIRKIRNELRKIRINLILMTYV